MKTLSVMVWSAARHVICHHRIWCLSPPALLLQTPLLASGSLIGRLFSSDTQCNSKEDIAEHMRSGRIQKIVVMAGAGISTPSGIPDFRTSGSGLYDNLQKYQLPYAEAIFDIDYFDHAPEAFFALARELYPSGMYRPNIAHYFVRFLHEKNILLRMYTQNIDGLERLAGIPEDKLMEAHGTFSKATCRICHKAYKGSHIKDSIFRGEVPRCDRSLCKGVIKPDIVFFGEQLPISFWKFAIELPQADLLIVMGTSLEVQPFAGVAEAVLPGTPRLLFNKEATGSFVDSPRKNDVVCEGDLVNSMEEFCELIGWRDELKEFMNTAEDEYRNLHKEE